jgi:hypothetical protein
VFVVVLNLNIHNACLFKYIYFEVKTLIGASTLPRLFKGKNALYL